MMPNMDPKQMEKLMRQMGIKSRQLEASKVIIELDGEKIVVTQPQVVEIDMHGQKSYQVSGSVSHETALSEDDIKLIMEQTGANRENAVEALKKTNGDMAEAILLLQGNQ